MARRYCGQEALQRDSPDVLDLSVLNALYAAEYGSGRVGLVAQLVALYLAQTPLRLAALQEAVSQKDRERVAETAHLLTGSSAQIGARFMVRLSATLQTETADLNRAAAQVAELQHGFERVRVALNGFMQKSS